MLLAGTLSWHTLAKQMLEGGLAACDPSFLFAWPFARVLAVFFLDKVGPERVVSAREAREIANRKRAEKGKPLIQRLKLEDNPYVR